MTLIMDIRNDMILNKLVIYCWIYIICSFLVFVFTGYGLSLFLIWNVFLACLPVAFSFILLKLMKRSNVGMLEKVVMIMLFLSWLFFFPNTFYLITDFIHLQNNAFYMQEHMYSPYKYLENIDGYLLLVQLFFGACLSVVMGTYSLTILVSYCQKPYSKIYSHIFIFIVMLLSSIAIYIGRFLRFNSWDMLRPIDLIYELMKSIDVFFLQFIIVLLVTQLLLFYFFDALLRHNVKN